MHMKITFIGATHQVTGSKTLVEWNPGRWFLVDFGMEQGENPYSETDLPVSDPCSYRSFRSAPAACKTGV